LIAEGSTKLASVPSGGAGGAAPAAGGAAAGGAAEEKEEEKKEEGMSFPSHISPHTLPGIKHNTNIVTSQRRKSPTRIWASVSSTKRSIYHSTRFSFCEYKGRLLEGVVRAGAVLAWDGI
jgi:hypothetical protein